MDYIGKLQKFLKFVCAKYEKDDTFRSYGEYAWPLVDESSVYFGDGRAQLETVKILVKEGLMEIVRPAGGRRVGISTRVRPSLKGLRTVNEARKSPLQRNWLKLVSAVTEGLTEGVVKGIKG